MVDLTQAPPQPPQVNPLPLPPDPTSSFRQASFTLNQNIQVERLVCDAAIPDVEFSANNSDANVNIKCSSGFYKSVAMPAFSTLSPGFSHEANGLKVVCSNIEPSLDYKGVEFNRIFWFTINDPNNVQVNVTVHLHHSARLVQVQGAGILGDGSVAAVWFVKHLLLGLFLRLGKARGHDIAAFNNAVMNNNFGKPSNDVSFDANSCHLCSKAMKKPAKPIKCFVCKKTFHTSCHKQHPCSGTPSRPASVSRLKRKASDLSSINSTISPPSLSFSPPTVVQQIPAITYSVYPSLLPTISTPPTTTISSSVTISLTTPSLCFSQAPRLSSFCTSSLSQSPSTQQPPSLAASLSLPPHPSSPPRQPVNPPPPKRQRKGPATSQDSHSQEFLKIQLNLAQTKITSQDANLKRKEESISILTERLRLLELGINSQLMSQYFPSTTGTNNSPGHQSNQHSSQCGPPPPVSSSVSAPPPSYHRTPDPPSSSTCSAPQISTGTNPTCHKSCCSDLFTELKIIKQQVSEMRADMTSVLAIIQVKSSVLNPPNSCSSHSPNPEPDKTSRHTQTRPQEARTVPQSSLAPSRSGPRHPPSRPIRPLFPPCPWENGCFPPGPVRQLGPPRPQASRSRSRSRQSRLHQTPSRPSFQSGNSANPTPSYGQSSVPIGAQFPETHPVQHPLITVVLDEDDDLAPVVTHNPVAPADYSSLNF